jgi:hypothetical protein
MQRERFGGIDVLVNPTCLPVALTRAQTGELTVLGGPAKGVETGARKKRFNARRDSKFMEHPGSMRADGSQALILAGALDRPTDVDYAA